MIDVVRMTFTALRQAAIPTDGTLSVLPVDAVEGAFLGIDSERRPHLLLAYDGGRVPVAAIATLEIGQRALVIGGATVSLLDLRCTLRSLEEVFDHFVVSILDRLAGEPAASADVVDDVLSKWRLFLAAPAATPSRDRLAAVFGELLVVLDVIRADPARRVDLWAGPYGGRHDIRRGSVALEVKTTRANTSRIVTIHGEDQLVEPDGGCLYLHLVRLEEVVNDGRSVPALVDELLSLGVAAESLFDALTRADVSVADFKRMSDVTFSVRERLTFPVDDQMPRIIASSFATGSRPVGVVDLSYRIDLDHCVHRAIEDSRYTELVDRLARGDGG